MQFLSFRLLVTVCLAASCSACIPRARTWPVDGQLLEEKTGRPVTETELEFTKVPANFFNPVRFFSKDGVSHLGLTTTDRNGRFRFEAHAPPPYEIWLRASKRYKNNLIGDESEDYSNPLTLHARRAFPDPPVSIHRQSGWLERPRDWPSVPPIVLPRTRPMSAKRNVPIVPSKSPGGQHD